MGSSWGGIAAPGLYRAADGVIARLRTVQPLVQLRVPFTVSRQDVDDVERGAQDSDWQPVKDAAKKIAFAEDRAVFERFQRDAVQVRAACRRLRSTLFGMTAHRATWAVYD